MSVSASLVAVLFLGGVPGEGAESQPPEEPAPAAAPSDAALPNLKPEPRFESVAVGTSEARTSGRSMPGEDTSRL